LKIFHLIGFRALVSQLVKCDIFYLYIPISSIDLIIDLFEVSLMIISTYIFTLAFGGGKNYGYGEKIMA